MKKALLLLFVIMILTSCEFLLPDTKGEVYYVSTALNYGKTSYPLRGTINDQIAMDAQMAYLAEKTNTPFHKYSIREKNGVLTLTDNNSTEEFNDTISFKLKQILTSIVEQAEKTDTIIFYYSGHGANEAVNKIPSGSFMFSFESAANITDYLSPEDLIAIFKNTKAKVLPIIDSCYSGNFSVGSRPDSNWSEAFTTFFETDSFPNIWILAASTENQESWENQDSKSFRHGYFTKALLNKIGYNTSLEIGTTENIDTTYSVGGNGRISVTMLADYLQKHVSAIVNKQAKEEQHPQSSLSFADLVLF